MTYKAWGGTLGIVAAVLIGGVWAPKVMIRDGNLDAQAIESATQAAHLTMNNPIERLLVVKLAAHQREGENIYVTAYTFAGIKYAEVEVGPQGSTVVWRRWSVKQTGQRNEEAISGLMFEVTVPQNTPQGDTVHIYLHTHAHYKMEKVGAYNFRITLTKEQLQPNGDTQLVRYRYSRNGYDFHTAEYLEPDTNDYFWTQQGRETNYAQGKVKHDMIARWRWFPPEGSAIVTSTPLVPHGAFLPRVHDAAFRSGQIIEDYYDASFHDFFESTAAHLKEVGYRWVEIDPPWQWIEENGLPKVVNLSQENPNYPDDQTLKEEIRAYKRQGLKVMLGPQLCCTALSTEDRSDAWWDAYFSETTAFLVHHADIAEETGVDAMHYAIGNEYQRADYADRWRAVFRELRNHFSGELGEMVWNFGQTPKAIIPDAKFIAWGSELDYFYVALDTPLSLKDNPTDEELSAGAALMLDAVRQLFDRFGKPIFVRTTYFNVAETWKGNTFYDISSVPWVGSEEKELTQSAYTFESLDLARVVNAYFRAIAERPWVIGYAQFGYSHWENPLSPDLSVRGKPAEDIWHKWNLSIYAQ